MDADTVGHAALRVTLAAGNVGTAMVGPRSRRTRGDGRRTGLEYAACGDAARETCAVVGGVGDDTRRRSEGHTADSADEQEHRGR